MPQRPVALPDDRLFRPCLIHIECLPLFFHLSRQYSVIRLSDMLDIFHIEPPHLSDSCHFDY